MFRIRVGILCLVVALFFGMVLEVSGQNKEESKPAIKEMCVPMGVIVLKPHPSVKQKRSPVAFNHSKHFNYDCRTCHHKWEGKTKVPNCTTAKCHDLLKSPKKPTRYLSYTKEGIKYYKYAYHENCIGCHKEVKMQRKKLEMAYKAPEKEAPPAVPTSCTECHPKE